MPGRAQRGQRHAALGLTALAAAGLALAVATAPLPAVADPAAHLRRAIELRALPGRAADEVAELDRALGYFPADTATGWPNRAFLLNERGLAAARAGRPDEALTNATEAVALGTRAGVAPDRMAAYRFNLGLAEAAHGDLDRALAAFDDAATDAATVGSTELSASATLEAARVALRLGLAADALDRIDLLDRAQPDVATLEVEIHLWRRDVVAARDALGRLPVEGPQTALLTGRLLILEGEMDAAGVRLGPLASPEIPAPLRASALYNLAEIEFMRGRFPEAQIANAAAADAFREAFGDRATGLGLTLHRQALIDQEIGDVQAAAENYDRTLQFLQDTLPAGHLHLIATQVERSILVARTTGAEDAIASLVPIVEATPDEDADYVYLLARAALGLVLFDAGRFAEARVHLEAVQLMRAGRTLPETDEPPGLNALAILRLNDGDEDGARKAVQRAIAIQERAQMIGVDKLGESRRILAEIEARTGSRTAALELARQNSTAIGQRLIEQARVPTYAAAFAPRAVRDQVGQLLKLLWDSSDSGHDNEVAEEMFLVAQLVHLTETSAATNGFVRRVAQGSPEAIELLDARDRIWGEIVAQSRSLQAESSEGFGRIGAGQVSAARGVELQRELARIDAALSELLPETMELLTPRPETAAAVAATLGSDEAIWLHVVFDEASYGFVLSSAGMTVHRLTAGSQDLAALVAELRASVDLTRTGQPPPFAWDAAQGLFDALFGPMAEDLAQFRRLALIPDGAAQQISHALLARRAPDLPAHLGAGHPELRFLGLTHALGVYPSPRAFLRLRAAEAAPQTRFFIGIGDPDLSAPPAPGTAAPSPVSPSRSIMDVPTGLARPDRLRNLFVPLPETAEELALMASVSEVSELFLRDRARESVIRVAQLGDATAIAFATHAIVTGEFDNLNEPAIILTPPDTASPEDDGLLTTSEIATLDLAAEIVILSACNTGSTSGRPGAAGLTGLASGFFEAGARALVVSHWTIDTNSSLVILPLLFRLMADEKLPPSVALQRVMWVTANNPDLPGFSHPARWAPFAVVGGS